MLSAIYLAWNTQTLSSELHKSIEQTSTLTPTTIAPSLVKKRPLAVLVLDLSGSMKGSDPTFQQHQALATFLRIYRHIAAGAVASGRHPDLGLVLYSESAHRLGANGRAWIPLTSETGTEELLSWMSNIIGVHNDDRPDPRIGLRTDHIAAAEAVGRLVADYRRGASKDDVPTSVCTVFMTDGQYDPSPLVDAALGDAALASNRRAFWSRLDVPDTELKSDFESWVGAIEHPLEIGSRTAVSDLFPLLALRRACTGTVAGGAGRFDAAEAALATAGADASPRTLRRLCGLRGEDRFFPILLAAPGAEVAGWGRSVDADDLAYSFAAALADWLELKTIPVDADGGFSVQPDARSLAVLVRTTAGPAEGRLLHGGESIPLENGLALIESPSAGPWRVETTGGRPTTVRVYSDARYEWALRDRPADFSLLVREAELKLALHDTESPESPIKPETLYSGLPDHAEAVLTSPDGTSHSVRLVRTEDSPAYVAPLPPEAAGEPGELRVEIILRDLIFANGMAAPDVEIASTIEVGDAVEFGLYLVDEDDETRIGGLKGVRLRRGGALRPTGGSEGGP